MADVIYSQSKNSEAPESASASGYHIIGKPGPRHDAWSKVLGNTVYAADYLLPDMLYAKVLRSEHAAARIRSIDTSEAAAIAGVVAVMTAKDVPNNETVTKFGQTHTVGGFEGHRGSRNPGTCHCCPTSHQGRL